MKEGEVRQQLKTITNTIVREFDPEKIILFGSWAWGAPGPDSDVDLLVVKRTAIPRRERQRQLSRLLYPRRIAVDLLVYTPEELNERITKDRNLFLEDVVTNGKILYAR